MFVPRGYAPNYQSVPKEWRRRRAEKWSSKRVCLESPFLLCSLKTLENLNGGQRRNGLSKTPFWTTISPHDAFSAPLADPQIKWTTDFVEICQGKETHPKKPPTQMNQTENSLRKQFAQTLSACPLLNLKERGRTVSTNSSEKCSHGLFIGVSSFGGGFPSL